MVTGTSGGVTSFRNNTRQHRNNRLILTWIDNWHHCHILPWWTSRIHAPKWFDTCGTKSNLSSLSSLESRNILVMEEFLHQLRWSISHYLQGFIRISSINSSTLTKKHPKNPGMKAWRSFTGTYIQANWVVVPVLPRHLQTRHSHSIVTHLPSIYTRLSILGPHVPSVSERLERDGWMAGWILVERRRVLCTFMINIDIDMCIYCRYS